MQYLVLATDYDGTIAHHGKVAATTIKALKKLRESGRKLLLVTGRELDDLQRTFEHFELFDRIVAENGALIYDPATKEVNLIGSAPSAEFVADLKRRGVSPISVGKIIVATWEPHEAAVLESIRDLGLEMQVIFNKGAVMVLPSGVNKAKGLAAALAEMGISRHNIVGVGDAENDLAFLKMCGRSAAVANAIPSVCELADLVLTEDHGTGVEELIERILANDLQDLPGDGILLGEGDDGAPLMLDPISTGILVCGTSGSGKSTLTTGLLERVVEAGYQTAIFDPEGDYDALDFAISLGSPQRAPLVEEIVDILKDPTRHLSVNLLGVALEHRPSFFSELLPRITEMRARTGRPHLLVVDEAHHLLPYEWRPAKNVLSQHTKGIIFITVHPESLAPAVMETIDVLIAIGDSPFKSVETFCAAIGSALPAVDPDLKLNVGEALLYRRGEKSTTVVRTEQPKTERKRHSRKYAEGNLGPSRSFYFRGKDGKLNLRAQNLSIFIQLADGVDDATWQFHLQGREYSAWISNSVKDPKLAYEIEAIERDKKLSPAESRLAIRNTIEAKYTLPADKPSGHTE